MNEHYAWVGQLLQRYLSVTEHQEIPSTATLHALNTLQLADAVLNKAQLSRTYPEHARQFAIIGPTQSGKSTLVNILLDTTAAGVSALAGFTVHAQGYVNGYTDEQIDTLQGLMAPLQRTSASELSADKLDTYVLERVDVGSHALISPGVVWDTPDFDSIDASTYTRAVLNTVAIADVVILMVSKDKYGDKSVWDMLTLLQPLNKPLMVCINKLDPNDEETVHRAFSARFEERFPRCTVPPTVLFPFVRKTSSSPVVQLPTNRVNDLQASLAVVQEHIDRTSDQQHAESFIQIHRSQWLAPLHQEQQDQAQWEMLVREAMEQAEQRYEDEYLNNPDKYDTFNRALAELLILLEIPGLAPTLAKTRQWVTWPARKLLGLGRTAIRRGFTTAGAGSATTVNQEADTLAQLLNGAMISMQTELLDQPQSPFWRAINHAFRRNQQRIRDTFEEQSDAALEEFAPQIEAAAQRLFEKLQSQPVLLNTLRAARVTADAAGVALAIKSGGLAPTDLVLAPAMLSVTTLLTESALGRYLDTIKNELRTQQQQHINATVIQGILGKELMDLSYKLDDKQLFTQQLEPEIVDVLAHSHEPTR